MTKTELIKKQEELTKIHEESQKELDTALESFTTAQEEANKALRDTEYLFNVKTKSNYKKIQNYLLKEVPWNYQSMTQLILLVANMDLSKDWVASKEFDGKIKMRGLYILNLSRVLREAITGKGFYDAGEFAKLMSELDEGFNEVMKDIQEKFKPAEEMKESHKLVQQKFYAEEQELEELNAQIAAMTSAGIDTVIDTRDKSIK